MACSAGYNASAMYYMGAYGTIPTAAMARQGSTSWYSWLILLAAPPQHLFRLKRLLHSRWQPRLLLLRNGVACKLDYVSVASWTRGTLWWRDSR